MGQFDLKALGEVPAAMVPKSAKEFAVNRRSYKEQVYRGSCGVTSYDAHGFNLQMGIIRLKFKAEWDGRRERENAAMM